LSNLVFRKYQPLSLRLWHWLNAIVILGLLATVLIRKTFLSWRTNSVLIENKLNEAGLLITPQLAKDIAVSIRNPLWDWHIYLGFALAALFVVRLLIVIFIEKKIPGVLELKSIMNIKKTLGSEKKSTLHFSIVKIGYGFFYLVTLFMVISGLVLHFKAELSLGSELSQSVKDIHELTMWFFVAFIGAHLLGVIKAEHGPDKGIVSDMINGGADLKR
jgi:Ni/Fe-hydrogenase 1 B-type cytochrome subunit